MVNNHCFVPVLVIFLAGLMGFGGFVWAGNSSPWGWECGVCFLGRTGFFTALCSGCGCGLASGWCRASSSWRSRSCPGPVLTGAFVSRMSFGVDCLGGIISDLHKSYKKGTARSHWTIFWFMLRRYDTIPVLRVMIATGWLIMPVDNPHQGYGSLIYYPCKPQFTYHETPSHY